MMKKKIKEFTLGEISNIAKTARKKYSGCGDCPLYKIVGVCCYELGCNKRYTSYVHNLEEEIEV